MAECAFYTLPDGLLPAGATSHTARSLLHDVGVYLTADAA